MLCTCLVLRKIGCLYLKIKDMSVFCFFVVLFCFLLSLLTVFCKVPYIGLNLESVPTTQGGVEQHIVLMRAWV